MTRHLSACFFLLVLLAGIGMSALYAPRHNFSEKAYNEALPLEAPSRMFWGRAEYVLFGQGRRGVVVGQYGWLFTAEEFECPCDWQQNLERNLNYISDIRRQMAERAVPLRVLIIPAKSRVYPQFPLPGCRQGLYEIALIASDSSVHLLGLMQAQPAEAFMRTDTHWSSMGAALAAGGLAIDVPPLVHTAYDWQPGVSETYSGDLLRYLPGVEWPAENLPTGTVTGGATGLLDDTPPPVVLVGTSYSANPKWGFENALRFALQADVQNMADEGLGPFAVMGKYLESESWKTTPPKLLIWEIPERYLVLSP